MPPTPQNLPRKIGFWGAIAVMVGIIIGSGIFRTPTSIAQELGSPWLILALWGVGGVLSLFGAFTYAELAAMKPQTGGVYVFLRDGYGRFGRCLAFVFGWTYLLITKPLAAAGIATVFGENVNIVLAPVYKAIGATPDPRLVTSIVLVILSWINARGVRLGTGVAGVLTAIKVGALVLIVLLTAALMKGTSANFETTPSPTSKPLWLALAPVMAAIMWTYDGWSDVGSLAGEVKDPQKKLASIYIVGTIAVTGLYVAVNAAYLAMMPLSEMRGTNSVAPIVAERLLGGPAMMLVAGLIAISTLGSTHGSIMTGARISYAQARDGLLFGFLGRIHPRHETPHVSLWFQLILSISACWLGSFEDLANGFVFTMWIFYGLAAGAIFTLRRTEPDAPRSYKCFGYPVVPAVFILASVAMTVMMLNEDITAWWHQLHRPNAVGQQPAPPSYKWPVPITLVWSSVLVLGVPVYAVWNAMMNRRLERPSGRCANCGYSMRGLETKTVCPECGNDWKIKVRR